MPASPDARAVVDAIKENTRELRKTREAIEKIAKTLTPRDVNLTFSGYSPDPINLEPVKHDYDNSNIDGPNGPIEPR